MSYSNISIIIGTIFLACLFSVVVFININIRDEKEDLDKLRENILLLELKIKRQNIEIASLTNPAHLIDYINRNALKPAGLNDIEIIVIKK